MAENENEKGWVCVTGATGFVAGHVVEELLKEGYWVKATVRKASDTRKSAHLVRLGEKYAQKSKLVLVEGDLLKPGSYDKAVEGCWGVLHVASPVSIEGSPKDPQKELVDPAIEGTLNVLRSCQKARVKKVVVTSSVASVRQSKYDMSKLPVTCTESDHNTTSSLWWDAYAFSKVEAERAMTEFVASLPKEERFGLASVHPSLVIGPQQTDTNMSSNLPIRMLLAGEYPFAPPLHFSSVDARDVARAHIFLLENNKAEGRFLVTNTEKGGLWMRDMGRIIKKHFPDSGAVSWELPVWGLRLLSFVDKRVTPELLARAGVPTATYISKRIEDLGFKFKYKDDVDRSVCDAAQSMIDLGIVSKKPSSRLGSKMLLLAVTIGVISVVFYLSP